MDQAEIEEITAVMSTASAEDVAKVRKMMAATAYPEKVELLHDRMERLREGYELLVKLEASEPVLALFKTIADRRAAAYLAAQN